MSAFEHPTPIIIIVYSIEHPPSTWDDHAKWLAKIRMTVWLQADNDSNNVTLIEALQLHWYRSLWVLGLWHMSTENEMDLPGMCACTLGQLLSHVTTALSHEKYAHTALTDYG